ncbi:MAG: AAA family ATPase [Candidatus Dadabacteria bacterium]|nr:MAG: AAA family ATPase [Candidatus Dadabacteria bacterium]
MSNSKLEKEIALFSENFKNILKEIGKVIVGQDEVVRQTTAAIFAGGHALLEGVPGLGKTLLVKTIAEVLGLSFKRIQFTPDLMPTDITGTQVITESEDGRREFVFKKGPIFANVILADEINRATPKTQSALLEAMQERQVTVLDESYKLEEPFFVLATQNPIELEGTYPLPEAQLDRFLIKIIVEPPTSDQLKDILERTTGRIEPRVSCVFTNNKLETINNMKRLVRQVVASEPILEVIARIISALTPNDKFATPKVRQYVRFGPGPRGAQALLLLSKVFALLDSRINVAYEDIKEALLPTLRHRIVTNFSAEADGITSDVILNEIKNAR